MRNTNKRDSDESAIFNFGDYHSAHSVNTRETFTRETEMIQSDFLSSDQVTAHGISIEARRTHIAQFPSRFVVLFKAKRGYR